MRILLMGCPNVGKSAIFSRLTGTHVVASNYSGTTVEFTRGHLRLDEESADLIDVPGAYTLEPTNRAEEVAVEMLDEGDLVINVVDATNLERNLNLTLQLLQHDKPVIVALNMWDEAQEHGMEIDVEALEEKLGVPVVPTCALSGEGIKELRRRLPEADTGGKQLEQENLWQTIGNIVEDVQQIRDRHPTVGQELSHATVHPVVGPFIAALVLMASFGFVAYFGDWLVEHVMERAFTTLYLPLVTGLSDLLGGEGIVHGILIGQLIEGEIDLEQSFGLLTTGLFIPIAVVLPFIFCFYCVLSLLEDIGYLPRLGVLIDTLMHRIGLHGLSIVPMMLGLGCNVPGALAGRVLETRKERFIVSTLLAICVPCMAQIAMVVGLLGQAGVLGLAVVFCTLLILWIALGIFMKLLLKGETPEILVDIPPYRFPYWKSIVKKVYMRMRGFLQDALPYVLLGVFIVNLLYTLGVIGILESVFGPVITRLFGLPAEAVGALIVGFLRKDVAVGMLAPLDLGIRQLIVASVVLVVYFPCVATFVVMFKELGLKDMVKATLIMITVALSVGTGLNLLLRAAGV
ncbi:MAG: FeoB small GTPase domain-containing protein [Planctomycetota bacterium]